jgi:hypothetical protein
MDRSKQWMAPLQGASKSLLNWRLSAQHRGKGEIGVTICICAIVSIPRPQLIPWARPFTKLFYDRFNTVQALCARNECDHVTDHGHQIWLLNGAQGTIMPCEQTSNILVNKTSTKSCNLPNTTMHTIPIVIDAIVGYLACVCPQAAGQLWV